MINRNGERSPRSNGWIICFFLNEWWGGGFWVGRFRGVVVEFDVLIGMELGEKLIIFEMGVGL
jgi:hypothetical protein